MEFAGLISENCWGIISRHWESPYIQLVQVGILKKTAEKMRTTAARFWRRRIKLGDSVLMRILILCLAVLLQACASNALKSRSLGELRIVAGVSKSSELIEQAGLPARIETVNGDNGVLKRYVYIRGVDQVTFFVPVPVPSGNGTYSGILLNPEYSTYNPTPDVAFACLISSAELIVNCVSGGSEE